jgi:hypothetical protein
VSKTRATNAVAPSAPRTHRRKHTRRQRRCRARRVQGRRERKRQRRRSRKQDARTKRHRPDAKHTAPLYRSAIQKLVHKAYGALLHKKQQLSLFMIGYAIIWSDRLGIAEVGTALARRAFGGRMPKHGKKQVDRCLSNENLALPRLFAGYVPMVVGRCVSIGVALDWTEFDKDDHSTVSLSLVTRSRRSIPLVWLTVKKSELKGRQRKHERKVLRMLADALPLGLHVIILADRGFGDVKLYHYIQRTLGFDFVIRFRPNIYVESEGWLWPAGDLVPRNGRIRVLRDTTITEKEVGPYTVVLTKAAGMKEPWCLATSLSDGKEVVRWYSRRFQCEEAFRDLKDKRYGYGLRLTRIRKCKRRDRFLLLFALAYLVQTLMGAGSEAVGLDKDLRSNTVQDRIHSLFNQGRALLGKLRQELHSKLAERFEMSMKELLRVGLDELAI